jgi:hypothetical protein
VSLSWRDRIVIELAPRQLSMRRHARGFGQRVSGEIEASADAGEGASVGAAIALLDNALERAAWRHADVEVVVSNHWLRYAVVPWSMSLGAPAERRAYAQELLAANYGRAIAGWDLGLSHVTPELVQLAAMLEPSLLGALRAVFAARDLRLTSLVPRLVARFNHWRARLPADHAWFVCLEPGMLTAVSLAGGIWTGVHSLRCDHHWGGELKRLTLLDRHTPALSQAPRLLLDGPPSLRSGADGLEVEWLTDARVVPSTQHRRRA